MPPRLLLYVMVVSVIRGTIAGLLIYLLLGGRDITTGLPFAFSGSVAGIAILAFAFTRWPR